MKVSEIIDGWKEDAKIDHSELSYEEDRVYNLHGKYLDLLIVEKMNLKMLEDQYKKEYRKAYEFFTQGPASKEDTSRTMPSIGRILRADVGMYLDDDDTLQKMSQKIVLVKQKVEAFESILKMVMKRGYSIKNIIDWEKWIGGN